MRTWLAAPNGPTWCTAHVSSTSIRGHNALQEVALAPGSTKTFDMCYEASGHNGVYSFTYNPTFFTTADKLTWSVELTDG
ncbi:hypothetical protein [Corynebacterium argentoratense]|uniref:hypothetical protein n=1 Tax=Corynebacterium argentoratense TaxID=42817 RepID=UPI001F30EA2A|nr:hypothetical protein [Corynebacterium argentoratense]MCF1711236.1 hypothetical protein [Corynebacterium argentoratense]